MAKLQKQNLDEEKKTLETQKKLTAPDVDSARFNYVKAQGDVAAAQVQLAGSVGLPGNIILKVVEWSEPPDVKFVAEAVNQMIEMALRNRPDIADKWAAYKSARALARQARSNIYPTLNATLSGATTAADTTTRIDDPMRFSNTNTFGRSDSLYALLEVNIPVFDGFGLINKARAAQKMAEAAHADLANSELAAISDVASNFAGYQSAVDQYVLAKKLEDSAQTAYDSAKKDYCKALNAYAKARRQPNAGVDQIEPDNCGDPASSPTATPTPTPTATPMSTTMPTLMAPTATPSPTPTLKPPPTLEELRTALDSKLNSYKDALSTLDGARTQLSKAKLAVFTASFQLANATGMLIPAVARREEPSVRSIPLPK